MTNIYSMESLRPKDNGQMTRDKDRTIKKVSVTLSSLVVEAGSLKGRLTDLRYCWICLFLTGD